MNFKTISILSILSLVLYGCSSSNNEKVATVGGEDINLKDFYEYVQAKPTMKVSLQGQEVMLPVTSTIAFQALEDLINQKLLTHLALDQGVMPSDQDVEKEIEFKRKLEPKFINNLIDRGFNIKQIRSNIKLELAQERLLTKGINLSMSEVDQYIATNKSKFVEPATVDMSWIFVKDKLVQTKVDQELATGQSFPAVAIKYSQFPRAETDNGRFPNRVIETLPPAIKQVVEKTNSGLASDWISFNGGFAKFYIDQKTEPKPIVMDSTRKAALQRNLALQRGKLANDIGNSLLKKFKESTIVVQYDPLKKQWADLLVQMKEVEKAKNKQEANISDTKKTNNTALNNH